MSSILYLWKQQVGLGYFIKLYFVPYLVGLRDYLTELIIHFI